MIKLLHKSLIKEILSLTFIILAGISSIFFMVRLMKFSNVLFATEDGLFSLPLFFLFLLPQIIRFLLPLSLLLASTIVLSKMAQERELEAWMSFGVGVKSFLIAPVFIGVIVGLLTLVSGLWLEPFAMREQRRFTQLQVTKSVGYVLESRLSSNAITPDIFGRAPELSIYVRDMRRKEHEMKGILIATRMAKSGEHSVITAREGEFKRVQKGQDVDFVLHLKNGNMYQFTHAKPDGPEKLQWNILSFKELDFSLVALFNQNLKTETRDLGNEIRSQGPVEYWKTLKTVKKDPKWGENTGLVRRFTFFYEKFISALACFFLPIIGVCLGIHDPRKKTSGASVGIIFVALTFYTVTMFGERLARKYVIPPEAFVLFPFTYLMILAAILSAWRAFFPPSVGFFEFLKLFYNALKLKLRGIR